MTTLLSLQLALVAAGVTAPDPADVKPGWLGFGVFLALAAAVVLLWLSMRRHLKKVDFEEEPDGAHPDDGTPHTP
jgi:hypothetical protein